MSATATLLRITATGRSTAAPSTNRPLHTPPRLGTWPAGQRRPDFSFRLQCSSVSTTPLTNESANQLSQNGIQILGWKDEVLEDTATESETLQGEFIKEKIEVIQSMLQSMEDGNISASAYDTAWVALVEAVDGSGGPQFPAALEWISDNQLPDGSWGDRKIFSAHDRILNTLGCVVALKSWHMHPDMVEQGLVFIRQNICKLGEENDEHMPIGFEVAFPSLLEMARKLDIEIPYESPIIQDIYKWRNLKLTRIPMDILHSVPTTLLHSLEGMSGLDWKKLLLLKFDDGSFLFSPSSTAYACIQTKDRDCLEYLTNIVNKFDGGVPNVYPVDMFEHIWAVDRIQRLGISRYFQDEIKHCVDYIHRFWTDKGICWARNSRVHDIDDTAMAFRILRLHGVNISADVFQNFKSGEEFFCFAGQSNQAVTGMFNLYRASQLMFSNEKILLDAKNFSFEFLRHKQERNEILDKWIITKDLPGEVGYVLDVPWYASLSRLETRMFLEQYGGEDDVWIGKTLYRMSNVNNNIYLELGKMDYNNCQAIHQQEWNDIQKWFWDSGLHKFGLGENDLLLAYYVASASIFEPNRCKERIAWTKTSALIQTFEICLSSDEDRISFLQEIKSYCDDSISYTNGNGGRFNYQTRILVSILFRTLNHITFDALLSHGRDIYQHLLQGWQNWLSGSSKHNREVGQGAAELMVRTINLCSAREEQLTCKTKYDQLFSITNRVCYQIRQYKNKKDEGSSVVDISSISSIESDMQKLVELVLTNSPSDVDSETKNTFLHVARSFYYTACCDPQTINSHITKVLFERVE